jgi:hypothetical protein
MNQLHPRGLSDPELLTQVHLAAHAERRATVRLIALLMELEVRQLHLSEGFSSLFTFCTEALHLSEHASYNRIESARAARRFPIILELLEAGDVTLTCIRLLAPHLTSENHRDVLARARHKSKRDIELLAATLRPRPDVTPAIRKLPAPRADTSPAPSTQALAPAQAEAPAPPQAGEVKPLAPERYKIQFTVGRETYERLRRVQDLLRHSVPNGDPSIIFERALALLEKQLERAKIGATDRPRIVRARNPKSRHVPAHIKRIVWERDGGRCAYTGQTGRCTATGFLEYHHVVPFAIGGETSASNIELRCRAHNQYEAERYSGRVPAPCADLTETRSGTS